jgi:uncharacterized repeat protein (TIGR01451 family)
MSSTLFPSRRAALLLIGAAVSITAAAAAPAPLVTELQATRVVIDNGREVQHSAQAVRPGDTLLYTASYRNRSPAPLASVVATVPVPGGAQFIAAMPIVDGVMASVDGVNFERMPLLRRVHGSDGQWHDMSVPLAEIRALRWPARTLAAGETFTPTVRVRVIDTP